MEGWDIVVHYELNNESDHFTAKGLTINYSPALYRSTSDDRMICLYMLYVDSCKELTMTRVEPFLCVVGGG